MLTLKEDNGSEKPDYGRLQREVDRMEYPFAAEDEGVLLARAVWLERRVVQLEAEFERYLGAPS